MENLRESKRIELKSEETKYPKVSIGLPIYNAEKFIHKRIENLLSQTFSDFELIISDNASTDNSVNICKEFMKKDTRIKLYFQEKNRGQLNNFNFVLEKSIGEYFVWAAVDDFLLPKFLEKNVNILETKNNVVTSVSKIRMFGEFTENIKKNEDNSIIKKMEIKIKNKLSHMDCYPISGNYEKRISNFLKTCRHSQVFYGLHRTEAIKKCIIDEFIMGFDTFYALKLLKYGEIYVVNDILMEVYDGGDSRSGMFGLWKMMNKKWYEILYPWIPTTINFKKELGTKLFLRDLNFFIKLNLSGWFSLSVAIIRELKKRISQK
jgi:glycosyltransferase involved in cell wall biosynthesis